MFSARTGKRLHINLSNHIVRVEEIAEKENEPCLGGRGLNAKFMLEHTSSQAHPQSFENPILFAVGPLTGTFAPCSGWTSISTVSPFLDSPGYLHLSLPGHFGAQLKFSGFDQLAVLGKSERPVYLWMDGDDVRFENARPLWGRDTQDTTVAIQEEKGDRNIEVLCIGPAGEKSVSFANVVNRFSWAGDHIGLGYHFGARNLKAIAIRGQNPVSIDQPQRFQNLCLTLRERIHRDREVSRLREEGTFFLLGRNSGLFGIKNFNAISSSDVERKWGNDYFSKYQYGREGCFSCPIHCGRVTQFNEAYFGGIHLEAAWSLGPRIGLFDWEKTLGLYRFCQLNGLDPSAAGSLLSWLMDSYEKGIFSVQDFDGAPLRWGDQEAALRVLDGLIQGKGTGEHFRLGSFRAARKLGKGMELVAHSFGFDLPARDPRTSLEYALSLALFPGEWDYLRMATCKDLLPANVFTPRPCAGNGIAEQGLASEELKVLADVAALCPLIVSRLPLLSASDIAELTEAATGASLDEEAVWAEVHKTIRMERELSRRKQKEEDSLPLRFFKESAPGGIGIDRNDWEKEISTYYGVRK